jgi:hypothetical protein
MYPLAVVCRSLATLPLRIYCVSARAQPYSLFRFHGTLVVIAVNTH